MIHFRALTQKSIGFAVDDGGIEVAYLKTDMVSKNVKTSLSRKEFSDNKEARMYASTNGDKCPVNELKRYIDKLPSLTKEDCLFPLITRTGKISSVAICGKNTLGSLMNRLSLKLKLSKSYTNHCVRVTGKIFYCNKIL